MSELYLSGIGKRYGSTVALADVSLQIETGEFICLLGASGCGKTTLLRIIAGLETHDRGELKLDGKGLSGVPSHKRNIGMVFQSLALFPHLNVGGNIGYGLKMRRATSETINNRVDHLLELTGLQGFKTREVSSLSGGQRQRVAIARALALEPQLFLMDEPFSALDAALRDHLQQEVRKLQKELGITTIFVTHDQSEAMALADRIVLINDGRIEQSGSPKEIYQQPATRFVAEFIGNNNLLDVDINGTTARCGDVELSLPEELTNNLQGKTTLAVRPEQIVLQTGNLSETSLPEPGLPRRGLQGKIVTQRPVGALIEHEIDVAGKIFKQTCFQTNAPDVVVGDTVSLSWDWTQVWCLPDDAC